MAHSKSKSPSVWRSHLSWKEILGYSFGLFGFQMLYGLLNSYQAEFASSILGANMALIGMFILITRILSALFDPVVGRWMDHSKSRFGKFRSMILYSLAPLLITTILIFTDVPWKNSRGGTLVWLFVIYLLWALAFTMGDVPSQGIASVLTPDPRERTNVVSISNTFKQTGMEACSVFVPIACLIIPGGSRVLVKQGETDTPMVSGEYFTSAVIIAVVGCILFALIPLWNKERVPYQSGQTYTVPEMFSALRKNKPLMLVILSYLLGFARQVQMTIQVQASNAIVGSQNLVVVLGIATGAGSMISMIIIPFLVKKWGEKKVGIAMAFYGFVANMLSFVFGHLWFTHIHSISFTVLFYLFMFFVGLYSSSFTILPMIMTADTIDYYEYKTGERMEGASYAMLTLTIKVVLALCTAVGLLFVNLSGYSETVAAIAAGRATGFSVHTKDIIFVAYRIIPGLSCILATIPLFKYEITPEKKKEMAAFLEKKRSAVKEA